MSSHHNNTRTDPRPKPISTVNYGPELLATAWAMTAVSIAIVALRLVGNYKFHTLHISDIVTLLLFIAATISNVAVHHGYGQTAGSLDHHDEKEAMKYSTTSQALIVLAATAGRLTFNFYLIELLATRKRHRLILWALVPLQVIVNVVSVFLLVFRCSVNIGQLFSPGEEANCMGLDVQIDYGYFQGAFNSASDLLLAAWPIFLFWKFNWNVRVKLVLISLLSLGIFAMAASLVKTVEYPTIMKSIDPRTNRLTLLRWMFIEAGVVLITASIPCVRPILIHWVKKAIRKAHSAHQRLHATHSRMLSSAGQLTESLKSRWMVRTAKPEMEDGDFEGKILANLTTHIFAGDREFLDKHCSGIMKQVEVTVVADEIPLTENGPG
ncbi:hypothetical protein BDV25DRAFT_169665 [Aspergillus avenaceus]|uniref:Rhodopsin domain-containing protein n=1 Tax=Aspergillus avenaceus TaxID=36643 RepID=A0A5N6TKR8_ASPAV|nr:hypothetical protein BDV25DRAFT_169665 [Aspergillus avenaceus]